MWGMAHSQRRGRQALLLEKASRCGDVMRSTRRSAGTSGQRMWMRAWLVTVVGSGGEGLVCSDEVGQVRMREMRVR